MEFVRFETNLLNSLEDEIKTRQELELEFLQKIRELRAADHEQELMRRGHQEEIERISEGFNATITRLENEKEQATGHVERLEKALLKIFSLDPELKKQYGRYRVRITAIGGNKIAVIKVVRSITGLGLEEAKELVDSAPGGDAYLPNTYDPDKADEIRTALENEGATAYSEIAA